MTISENSLMSARLHNSKLPRPNIEHQKSWNLTPIDIFVRVTGGLYVYLDLFSYSRPLSIAWGALSRFDGMDRRTQCI